MPTLPDAAPLSRDEAIRFSRQIILPEFGEAGQARLRAARVLIVGLGGLGSPAALYLAAAGVGTLGLADPDRVELSNLHRQILHGTDRLGLSKVASARALLADLNPHTHLIDFPEGISTDNALRLFADFDLIIDGTDNFPTRYLNNDAAVLARKPLIYGSIFQYEGQVALFDPAHGGPCYRCLFPHMPPPGEVPNCAEAGVFGALCGVIGSLQALEALKLLTGIGQPLRSRLFTLDARDFLPRTLKLRRDPACPVCGTDPAIANLDPAHYAWSCHPSVVMSPDSLSLEIPVREAFDRLRSPDAPFLLDVREPFEAEICSLPASHLIPLKHLPEHLAALPRERPLLVYCHGGRRSLRAAELLRSHGFTAQSIRGGIDAWAEELEPSMPRY